ncbi:Minor histocompatibility antigen H13 [Mortierella polycephala]|uniref:Minor histocompatibility antigen H13 n=1 Tax=Mortierella polycephala TaxID=41804 RepID=A0A9P6U3W4_9FUNG|nr:Minor histocompatibility antigen H13 [Mortierella polycephala]
MPLNYVASPTAVEQGIYTAYAALGAMAIVPIYFGSFASLKKWKNPEDKTRTAKRQLDDVHNLDEDLAAENVSLMDAYTFPVLGSLTVLGLHYLLMHFDKTYVNFGLTSYFCVFGLMATSLVGVNVLEFIAKALGIKTERWHLNLVRKPKVMLVASVLLSGYYAVTKSWIASNIFGVCFALSTVQVLSLDSFKTGMVLLVSFFFYDLYWASGNEILAIVTKNLDAPIKVVFPRLLLGLPAGQAYKFMALGLGDIVIPGLFVALCLRYDQHRAGMKNTTLGRSTRFHKPYFIACLVAYILGLSSMYYITHVTKTTQPALMYLAPACIISVLMTAMVRGEIKQVFAYVSEEGIIAAKRKKEAAERKRR